MATGDKKRAVMTDDINNSGSSYPVMPLKTIDQTPTAGNTDHLISSAGVKSALNNPSMISLGSFTTLTELGTALDTQLAAMNTYSMSPVRTYAGSSANASPFVNSTSYFGILNKASSPVEYSSVILCAISSSDAILCRRTQADGWTFESIATSPLPTSASVTIGTATGTFTLQKTGGIVTAYGVIGSATGTPFSNVSSGDTIGTVPSGLIPTYQRNVMGLLRNNSIWGDADYYPVTFAFKANGDIALIGNTTQIRGAKYAMVLGTSYPLQ